MDEFDRYDTFYLKLLFITHVNHSEEILCFYFLGGGGVIIKIRLRMKNLVLSKISNSSEEYSPLGHQG